MCENTPEELVLFKRELRVYPKNKGCEQAPGPPLGREARRTRLQLPDERLGSANNTPRALHRRIAAIVAAVLAAQRFFIARF
jgi:hypothetical protein